MDAERKAKVYLGFVKEHLGLTLSAVGAACTAFAFIVATFATIGYVDGKHEEVVRQQSIDRSNNTESFRSLGAKIDTVGEDVKEILRYQRKN